MFFFFTLDDYLKSPCSFAHRCPLLWNVRSLKGPCCWSPHTQPLDTQETRGKHVCREGTRTGGVNGPCEGSFWGEHPQQGDPEEDDSA